MATTPIDLKKLKAEQMARVTGKTPNQPKNVQPVPPAMKPVAGVTGTPPLPVGKPLIGLTEMEREALNAAGYSEDVELPQTAAGLKELQSVIAQVQNTQDTLPVDPKTPPIVPEIKKMSDLPTDVQQRFRSVVENIRKDEVISETQRIDSPVPGMNQSQAAVNAAISYSVEVGGNTKKEAKAEPAATTAASAPEPETPPAAPEQPESQTGANVKKTHCGNCGKDLSEPDVPVPPREERIAFLHSILAFKPYTQEVTAYDGKLRLTFRGLTTDELSALYAQTAKDQIDGKLATVDDYYEKLNHYRLALQLVKVVTVLDTPIVKKYPEGLSTQTNPSAETVWVADGADVTLADILDYVIKDSLRSETLFRVVHQACGRFNRAVAKMEAMATTSDFTSETVSAS